MRDDYKIHIYPHPHTLKKALDESRAINGRQLCQEHLNPSLKPMPIPERLNEIQQKFGTNSEKILIAERLLGEIDPSVAALAKGNRHKHGDIDF